MIWFVVALAIWNTLLTAGVLVCFAAFRGIDATFHVFATNNQALVDAIQVIAGELTTIRNEKFELPAAITGPVIVSHQSRPY